MLLALPKILDKFPEQSYTYRVIWYGPVAQLGAHAVLKQSGVIYHAPPSGFWGLKYGLVAQLGERSVRIRKVEGSTPFESIKRRIVLNDTAFLFAVLCKIVHHSS